MSNELKQYKNKKSGKVLYLRDPDYIKTCLENGYEEVKEKEESRVSQDKLNVVRNKLSEGGN